MVASGDDNQFQLDGRVNVVPVREYKRVSGDPRKLHKFAWAYKFEHLTSSLCSVYPQSNGKVENAVQNAQNILKAHLITFGLPKHTFKRSLKFSCSAAHWSEN